MLNFQGVGAANELNISKKDFANREKRNYVAFVNMSFGQNFTFMQECLNYLHKKLKSQCQTILPNLHKNYKNAIHIVTTYDMAVLEKSLEIVNQIKTEIKTEKNIKIERENNYKEKIDIVTHKNFYIKNRIILFTKSFLALNREIIALTN